MNAMLSDEDLTRLFAEAAQAYDVPERGPAYVLEERGDATPGKPWLRRRGVQLTAAAAAVVVAAVLAQSVGGTDASRKQDTAASGIAKTAPGVGGVAGTGGALTRAVDSPAGGSTAGGAQRSAPGTPGLLAPASAPIALPQTAPVPAAASSRSLRSSSGTHFSANTPRAATSGIVPQAAPVGDGGDARVVKTGAISLVVDDGRVPVTVTKLTAVARSVRGGYVSDSSSQEFGDSPSASITMRVPVDSFDAVIAQIRALKAKVATQESSGKDITASYADTEAQIASLKAARSRFLTILSGARTIGETLTVQQRVDDVQARIDRLEGQRRVFQDQSEQATLTVTVGEKADAVLKQSTPSGLSKSWHDAKHGFTSGVEGLISRSGRALLVLILLVVVFFVGRFAWRLARRRLV